MADKILSCFRCLCCRLKQRVRLQSDTWYAISRCPCCNVTSWHPRFHTFLTVVIVDSVVIQKTPGGHAIENGWQHFRSPRCRQQYKPGSTRELNYLNVVGDHKNTPVFFEKHPPEPRKTIFPYRKTHLTLSLWLSCALTLTILRSHFDYLGTSLRLSCSLTYTVLQQKTPFRDTENTLFSTRRTV